MATSTKWADLAARMSADELEREIKAPTALKMASSVHRNRYQIDMAWAPFDHINTSARIAIVGITPGREQMGHALRDYREKRLVGAPHDEAMKAAKVHGSFSGGMRRTLVELLDAVAIPSYLGIDTAEELWGRRSDLAHFTSCLRWPIFVNGLNFTGYSPSILSPEFFRKIIDTVLASELASLPADCLIVPCGPNAEKAVARAAARIPDFDVRRLIEGFPHPSGAARDVSSQFLGRISPQRTKPLRPEIRQHALALRARVEGMA